MSKSLGNFDNLLDLLDQVRRPGVPDAAAAEPLPQPGDGRRTTTSRRPRGRSAGLDAFAAPDGRRSRRPRAPTPTGRARRVRARRWTTTSTPRRAMALVFDTVRRANAALDAGDATRPPLVAAVREIDGGARARAAARDDEVPDDVAARAGALDAARAAKDYATADAIRAALQAEGWIVETTGERARRSGDEHRPVERPSPAIAGSRPCTAPPAPGSAGDASAGRAAGPGHDPSIGGGHRPASTSSTARPRPGTATRRPAAAGPRRRLGRRASGRHRRRHRAPRPVPAVDPITARELEERLAARRRHPRRAACDHGRRRRAGRAVDGLPARPRRPAGRLGDR